MGDALNRFLRRRVFVVDRKLQGRLLAASLLHSIAVLLIVAASLFAPLMTTLWSDATSSRDAVEAASRILFLHRAFWPTAALALVLLTLASIRVSHKIAGPLLRIRRTLRALAEGQLPRAQNLRRGDFLQDVMDDVNLTVEGLKQRFVTIDDAERAVRRALAAARRAGPPGGGDLAHHLGEAERLLEVIRIQIPGAPASAAPVPADAPADRPTP